MLNWFVAWQKMYSFHPEENQALSLDAPGLTAASPG